MVMEEVLVVAVVMEMVVVTVLMVVTWGCWDSRTQSSPALPQPSHVTGAAGLGTLGGSPGLQGRWVWAGGSPEGGLGVGGSGLCGTGG